MKPREIIRNGITASVIAHLSVLMLMLLFSEVHLFGSTTTEPITVDLVPPAEAPPPRKEEPPPDAQPSDAFDLSSRPAAATPPAPAAAQEAAEAPQNQAAQTPPQKLATTPRPVKQQAAVQPPSPPPPPPPQPPPAATPPEPSFAPPQPDLSIKYHVMLGLPPPLPVAPPKEKSSDDFDAPASKMADIDTNLVSEFRRHLKTCSKLPASIAPSEKLRITLRVLMTRDGKLADEPLLIEASASPKGPALMQSAISALQACQPYAMLPADRYGEWRVLDLSFTPQDFAS
jgi:hypothetical protein